ncbi:MAG: hypothetical protein BHW52_03315 [Ruminococcus sp. 37_24]|nr:MAG: hypothetical protein BHW52_03315 [Ruminococcus sp. 37_24]
MKKYIDVDFNCGMTIEEAVKYLHQLSYKTGKDYCGAFNGNTLSSDMTVDEAYIKCIGKTFKEFKDEQEKMRQDLIRREEEHKKKIPELTKYWIKEGHKILSQDKWDEWDRCVPIRLGDLYEGMELGQCLDIIKTVKDNSIVAGIEVMKNQGHSGMSWGLMKSMIYTFCDCGNEFVETLDNM